jgi:hypothetical protein
MGKNVKVELTTGELEAFKDARSEFANAVEALFGDPALQAFDGRRVRSMKAAIETAVSAVCAVDKPVKRRTAKPAETAPDSNGKSE